MQDYVDPERTTQVSKLYPQTAHEFRSTQEQDKSAQATKSYPSMVQEQVPEHAQLAQNRRLPLIPYLSIHLFFFPFWLLLFFITTIWGSSSDPSFFYYDDMGNQGSPNPYFFYYDDFTTVRRHGLLRFAPRRRPPAQDLWARFARERSERTNINRKKRRSGAKRSKPWRRTVVKSSK